MKNRFAIFVTTVIFALLYPKISALAATRTQLGAFERSEPHVAAAHASLDKLDQAQLAPTAPALLGTALKELRNLRATHALRSGVPPRAAPKADEAHGAPKPDDAHAAPKTDDAHAGESKT